MRPGAVGSFTQHRPYLAPGDYHSLAELAVQTADFRQTIEVGWTVDRGLDGDDLPHLFGAGTPSGPTALKAK